MRWRAILPLVLSVPLLAAGGCAADAGVAAARDNRIVVGVSLELSGPTASIGTSYRKALELKAAQLNASGALGGRKLRLVLRDNRTDNNASVANVDDFIKNQHAAALILGGCSQCAVAAIPAITENHVPAISLASASTLTTPVANRRYVFKVSPDPDQDAQVITGELRRKDINDVGLIAVDNLYGQDGRRQFTRRAQEAGIRVAVTEKFGQSDTSVAVQVAKVVSERPQAVVIWAVSPAASILVKELHDAHYGGAVYLDAGAGAELFLRGAGAAAEGTNMVFPTVLATQDIDTSTPAGAARKAWVDTYEKQNGEYSGFASFAADALQTIADAVTTTGGTDREQLRAAIEADQFDGISGPLRFSATEHSGLLPAALGILTVRQGQWRLAR